MNHLNEIGLTITVFSFAIGTILLAFFLYFGESNILLEFGFVFIIVAFVINTIILTVLFGSAMLNPKHRLETLKTCGIMLLNIPLVIFYIYLIIVIWK